MVSVKREKKIIGYSYAVYDDNGKYMTYFKSYNKYDEEELREFVEEVLHVDPMFSFLYIDHIYGAWKEDRKKAMAIIKRLKSLDNYYDTYHTYREYLPRNIFYTLHGLRFLIGNDKHTLLVIDDAVFFTRFRSLITLLYYIEQENCAGIMRKARDLVPVKDVNDLLSFISPYVAFGTIDRQTYEELKTYVLRQKLILQNAAAIDYTKDVLRTFWGERVGNKDKG